MFDLSSSRAHAFWLCRACQTARLDSSRRTCRDVTCRDELSGIQAYTCACFMACCLDDDDEQQKLRVNTGAYVLPLYCAPVPDVCTMIANSPDRCGPASVKLRISVGNTAGAYVSTSDESDDSEADDAAPDTQIYEVCAFIIYSPVF